MTQKGVRTTRDDGVFLEDDRAGHEKATERDRDPDLHRDRVEAQDDSQHSNGAPLRIDFTGADEDQDLRERRREPCRLTDGATLPFRVPEPSGCGASVVPLRTRDFSWSFSARFTPRFWHSPEDAHGRLVRLARDTEEPEVYGLLAALASAVLFGAATPAAKTLLANLTAFQ